jgi:DNA-directed RNA polymerase specialized sigma24 family protein
MEDEHRSPIKPLLRPEMGYKNPIRTSGGKMQVYARREHGNYPVSPLPERGFKVEWPSGVREYRSARQMIIALVNRDPEPGPEAKDPGLSFDRYFRLGRYAKVPVESELDVFDFFKPDPPRQVTALYTPKKRGGSPGITALPLREGLGIDLAVRGEEVRRVFFKLLGKDVRRRGYDPEDVLQEVYKGILVRNRGKCPFDANKSSFAHYVHMVASCILSNYHRKWSRHSRNECFGVRNAEGELEDVAESDIAIAPSRIHSNVAARNLVQDLASYLELKASQDGQDPEFILAVYENLLLGKRHAEQAEELCISKRDVSKAVRYIRVTSNAWKESLGPVLGK